MGVIGHCGGCQGRSGHFGSVGAEGAMGDGGSAILGFLVVFRGPYIVDISFKGAKNNNPKKSKDKEK